MSENAWGLLWVLSGLPFAIVCSVQFWRDERSLIGLLPGISIGLMFGPMSLLLIGRDEDAATAPDTLT